MTSWIVRRNPFVQAGNSPVAIVGRVDSSSAAAVDTSGAVCNIGLVDRGSFCLVVCRDAELRVSDSAALGNGLAQ